MDLFKKIGISVVLLLSAIYASAYTFELEGITYSIISLEDLTCEITSSSSSISGILDIPAEVEYNGRKLKIVSIGDKAFYHRPGITEVHLENASYLTYIGEYAFQYASGLTEVHLKNASLKTIDSYAFSECTQIQKIEIPATVKYLGDGAFRSCSALKRVIFMESPTPLEFGYYWKREPWIMGGADVYYTYAQFYGCPVEEVEILRDIKMATYCQNPKVHDVSNQVWFYFPWISQCSESITIGKNVKRIPYNLFLEMNPKKLILEDFDSPLIIEPYTTYKKNQSRSSPWSGYTYEDDSKYIEIQNRMDDYAAEYQKNMFCGFQMNDLEYIYWGRKVEKADFKVFYLGDVIFDDVKVASNSLHTFEIGNIQDFGYLKEVSSKKIEKIIWNNDIEKCEIFDDIPNLKELKFPNSLQVIKGFYNSPLKELSFGNGLNSITGFGKWTSLEKIYIATQQPPSLNGFSDANRIEATLYVPNGCKAAYSNAPGWKTFWNIKEYDFSGITDTKDESVDVFVNDNIICIEKAPIHSIVKIYQQDGCQIYHQVTDGNSIAYAPETAGMYIVKVGDKTYKVMTN